MAGGYVFLSFVDAIDFRRNKSAESGLVTSILDE
jgi:hypothetical protein